MRTLKLSAPPPAMLDVAAILLLLGLVLVFNPDVAFRGMVPAGYDTFVYFYPLRAYFAQAVAEGRLPLWNPHIFAGVPFLANPQAAVFYPGTWLFALIEVPRAYGINLLGHFFVAAAAMYGFVRWSLELGRVGALLGASAFAFSGFMAGQSGHINQVSVAAWLPAVALALDLTLRGHRTWASIGLIAGLVLQLLAGHPQEVYMTLVALGLLVLWRRWSDGAAALGRGLGILALATAIALGIAALQLLPTAELARLSIRSGGLEYEQAIVDALPWQLLLPALLPGYWSNLHTTELFGHLGAMALVVAWLGMLVGSGRGAALGTLLVLLGLGLAVGHTNPLYRVLFDWAPGFGSFRVPARWLFVYTFGASILVAVGTDWLIRRPLETRTWLEPFRALPGWRLGLVGIGVPSLLLVIAVVGQRQSRLLLALWAGLAVLTVILALGALVTPRARRLALGVLVAGIVVELWFAGANLEHRQPIPNLAYGQMRESTALLRSSEGMDGRFRMLSIATPEYEVKETPELRERFAGLRPEALKNLLVSVKWNEALVPNVPIVHRLDSADGYDGGVLPLASFVRLTTAMIGERARPDGVLASRLDHLPEARWLDLLGVRYVLAGRIKDITRDGLYFDRAVTATLHPGERLDLHYLPLGEFTRLGLLSSFRGPTIPGREVARLELARADGSATFVPLLDGVHTAAADAEQIGATPLERVQEWGVDDSSDPADWLAIVAFDRQPIVRLSLVNTTADATVEVRALNLVDDVRQASFPITPDERIDRTEFFDMKVYDRTDALPRAYVVPRAEVSGDAEAARRLADPAFDPRAVVLLDAAPAVANLPPAADRPGTVEIEDSRAERLRIRVRTPTRSFLVLSDSWYPGWRATIDGAEVPIARANVLFRAVEVPAGEHVVEFRFEPRSLQIGLVVSTASLLVGLALLWFVHRRRVGRA